MAATAASLVPSSLAHPSKPPHPIPKASPFLFPAPGGRATSGPCFLCRATGAAKSPTPPTSLDSSTSTPSLSDQLKPISLTLLRDQRGSPEQGRCGGDEAEGQDSDTPPPLLRLSRKPKSTWVNPSSPRPRVLSLRRHPRAAPATSSGPDTTRIGLVSRALADCGDDLAAFSVAVGGAFPGPPARDDALLILGSLRPWQKAHRFFTWLKTQEGFAVETIFYNVVMKSLRLGRQYELVEGLAQEMVDGGVELDNITYSTVITCAKRCGRFDRAIDWFDRMYRTGVMPDEVTYSAVLDVYAKLGKVEEVIGLYERGRASGWKPDAVAFSVLGRMFGEAGDYDGIRYVLEEMKSAGVEPNLVVYNTLLEAMGKAGKPGLARNLFDEMISAGLTPNEKTLTALTKIYGKARWSRDALVLWDQMRANRWPMDFILYNTLLSMCADVGLEEEAEKLFADMKASERCRPDSFSYTAMINIYSSGGKPDRAKELFDEMLGSGVQPNVMCCTCLIQCLGKARRMEDAVKVFGVAMENGVVPDDRLCACLLSVVALCKEGEMEMVLECLEKADDKLVGLLMMLGDANVGFNAIKAKFREILNETAVDARRPICNCLIDVCRNHNFPAGRAHELFSLGNLYGLYPGLHSKVSGEWSLNLRSLSIGAAHIAFEEWTKALSKCLEGGEGLPQIFTVHTGTGAHKFSQGLATAFAAHLETLAAPFQQKEDRRGCFVSTKEDLISWLQATVSPSIVLT
uniref:Pentatricopeptide repeat-containing protein At5g46580, chloroplastic n=1 Tax=Anthurium amnicola TaxID=1678845 RepID=A0A1D1XR71_9ARAE